MRTMALMVFVLTMIKAIPQPLTTPVNSQRAAFVIGESNYQDENLPYLSMSVTDAKDMTNVLKQLNFYVRPCYNTDLATTRKEFDLFMEETKNATTHLFYFSGHGMYFYGEAYILLSDTKLYSPEAMHETSITKSEIEEKISNGHDTVIFLFDACSTVPQGNLSKWNKRWFKPCDPIPRNMYEVLASSPGQPSYADPNGRNSYFTAALLTYIRIPNIPIDELSTLIMNWVSLKTNDKQCPIKRSGLKHNFYFLVDDKFPVWILRSDSLRLHGYYSY